jgi:hypothetical protein
MPISKATRFKILLSGVALFAYTSFNEYEVPIQRQLSQREVPIEFVSMPRNLGAVIERAGCENGFTWGSMKKVSDYELKNCKKVNNGRQLKLAKNSFVPLESFHAPPRKLKKNTEAASSDDTDESPYNEAAKKFIVVRNPYEKIASEYYDPIVGFQGDDKNKNSKVFFNEWIMSRLRNSNTADLSLKKHEKNVFEEEGHQDVRHYIAQVEYVFDKKGDRVVDYVLHYENLKQEFDELMNRLGLNITLPPEYLDEENLKGERFTYKDMDNSTLAELNHLAGPDFDAFGYQVITGYDIPMTEDANIASLMEGRKLFRHEDSYNPAANVGTCLKYHPMFGANCGERN